MKHTYVSSLVLGCLLLLAPPLAIGATSSLISHNEDGYLVYTADSNGNTLPDYSYAGYKLGTEPIPTMIPIKATVSPVSGDDTINIQSAIDTVEALTPDADGFRGVVLLEPGIYEVTSTLYINQSGVVLRGSGAGLDGTIIYHQGTAQSSTLYVTPTAGGIGKTYVTDIVDSYLPVGENYITVDDTSSLSVGQMIWVVCAHTQDWVDELGLTAHWNPGDLNIQWERKIVAIDSGTNTILLDSPLTSIIDSGNGFAQGKIYASGSDARLSQVGIEDIMFVSYYNRSEQQTNGYYNDEDHAARAIYLAQAKDSWVQRCTGYFYEFAMVHVWTNCNRITVQDCAMFDGVSLDTPTNHAGAREYYFNMDGSNILLQRCFARGARHAFTTNGTKTSNVFLHNYSQNGHLSPEPHQRWCSGILYDNVYSDSMFKLHGLEGSHGQSSANNMLWNCYSKNKRWWEPEVWLNSPPSGLGTNWVVGVIIDGVHSDPPIDNHYEYGDEGFVESTNVPVYPRSLYMAQARERIGDAAVYGVVTNDQYLNREAIYDKLLDRFSSTPSFGDPDSIASWALNTPSYDPNMAAQGYISLLDESYSINEWSNSLEVSSPVQSGTSAAQWVGVNLDAYKSFRLVEPPSDWSDYDRLSFWMYSGADNDAKVIITISSEKSSTTGGDYYSHAIDIDWTGWKHFSLDLSYPNFSVARSPAGWQKIDSITFNNKGFGAIIKSDTELYLDDIRLERSTEATMLDEADTIAAWTNCSRTPAIVASGTVSANWVGVNLDAYKFMSLSNPPTDWTSYDKLEFWMHSEVANNAKVVITIGSENSATSGGDYYQHNIDIDWSGWKHFSLDLSYPTFSYARSPAGWDQIDHITFANKGYGAIIKSDTQLRIDKVQLVAE